MKLLDRYLSRHFLPSYVLAGVVFSLFYCLVDLLSNLGEFMEKQAYFIEMIRFYLFFLPLLWLKLSPLAILIGVWFSVGHLAEDREIMAMRLCGISIFRIIAPLLSIVLIISLASLGMSLQLAPWCEEKKAEIWKGKIQREEEYLYKIRKNFIFTSQGAIYFVKYFNESEGKMSQIQIVDRDVSENTERRISSREALWHNGRWVLRDGIERIFDTEGGLRKAEKFRRKELSLSLTPHELWLYNRSPSFIPTSKIRIYLTEYKKNPASLYPYWAEFHARFSLPFINFTILVLSIPFCLLSLHQSTVGRIGWVLGFFLLYYFFFSLMVAASERGIILPPVGIWLPNIIFLILGILYLWRKR
ncbi:MAG TPA: YjgP/YjgQ family permease [Candidatus Omnitrophica bacterium]|nr:YjgP/YjgQ family permease [Candidatus Omnitrophota bacterium]